MTRGVLDVPDRDAGEGAPSCRTSGGLVRACRVAEPAARVTRVRHAGAGAGHPPAGAGTQDRPRSVTGDGLTDRAQDRDGQRDVGGLGALADHMQQLPAGLVPDGGDVGRAGPTHANAAFRAGTPRCGRLARGPGRPPAGQRTPMGVERTPPPSPATFGRVSRSQPCRTDPRRSRRRTGGLRGAAPTSRARPGDRTPPLVLLAPREKRLEVLGVGGQRRLPVAGEACRDHQLGPVRHGGFFRPAAEAGLSAPQTIINRRPCSGTRGDTSSLALPIRSRSPKGSSGSHGVA
jgi:hypothetical protein